MIQRLDSAVIKKYIQDPIFLVPPMLIMGVPLFSTFFLVGLIVILGIAASTIKVKNLPVFPDPFAGALILLSTAVLYTVFYKTEVLFVLVLVVALLGLRIVINFSQKSKEPVRQSLGGRTNGATIAATTSLVACALGWLSLLPYSLSLVICLLLRKRLGGKIIRPVSLILVLAGFSFSLVFRGMRPAETWLSFDQLFRIAVGQTAINWGFYEHAGAIGYHDSYHWLTEAIAAFLAKLTLSSGAVMLTVCVPLIALTWLARFFDGLGSQFGVKLHHRHICLLVVMVICKQFDIYSIGTLWGTALFLVAIECLDRLWRKAVKLEFSQNDIFLLALVTPLVLMSQTTLGICLLALIVLVAAVVTIRQKRMTLDVVMLILPTAISTVFLRITALSPPKELYYSSSVSVFNAMMFRGTDSYVGSNRLYILMSSLLYVMAVFQMTGGVWLVKHQPNLKGVVRPYFSLVCTCFLLANVFQIGDINAQQIRFFAPIIVVGTWLGAVSLAPHLSELDLKTKSVLTSIVLLAFYLFTFVKTFNSVQQGEWSRNRTIEIGTLIVLNQVVLVVGLGLYQSRRKGKRIKKFALLTIGVAMLSGHARNISDLISTQVVGQDTQKAEMFIGKPGVQSCLQFVRVNTPKNAVIASDLFRIPLPTQDEKYFLVSAWTERRVFVDGPGYVANPRPFWLQKRIDVADEFAQTQSKESFETLKNSGVNFFIMNQSYAKTASSNQLGKTIFEGEACYVIQL